MNNLEQQTQEVPKLGTRERLEYEQRALKAARTAGNAGRISLAHERVDEAGQAWLRRTNGESPIPTDEPPLAYAYTRATETYDENGRLVELTKTLPESPHMVAILSALGFGEVPVELQLADPLTAA